jgi:acetyl esterase/lipase
MRRIADIAYRSDTGQRGLLDVMLPDASEPFPVVVCIHGGGWHSGEKEGKHIHGQILADMGIAAVIPNYRLTGVAPHPAQEDDLFLVLDWIADRAAEYGFDPRRVGLTGTSAGGHLCALVGLKAGRFRKSRVTVRCMLPVCGVHDVGLWARDVPAHIGLVEALLGGRLAEKSAVERDVSPLAFVHAGAPPCLATHGALDATVPPNQSTLLVEALRRAGASAEAIIVPGEGHVSFMSGRTPPEPLGGIEPFRAFFTRHLL